MTLTKEKLSTIAYVLMGQSPPGNSYNENKDGVPLLNGPTEFGIDVPTPVTWTTKPTQICKSGDLLFCVRGSTTGRMNFADYEYCIGRGLCAIQGKSGVIDTKFVYYSLLDNISELLLIADGSVFPNLSRSDLENFRFLIPDYPIRKIIVDILGVFDETVINLRHQNTILEKSIKSIFNSWFINFDGQREFNSESGQIPKNWKYEKIGNVLSLLKDGSHNPPKRVDYGIRFIAGASNVKHFEIDFSKCTYITQEDYETIHRRYTIEPNDILLTIVGTIGNVAIVKKDDLPFSLQRSIAILRPNEKINYEFLYCLLNSDSFKQFLYSSVNPTGQPGIYLGTLSEFEFVLPPKPLLDKFEIIVEPIIKLIQINYQKIKLLVKIRDAFLPKLMSGEIRI